MAFDFTPLRICAHYESLLCSSARRLDKGDRISPNSFDGLPFQKPNQTKSTIHKDREPVASGKGKYEIIDYHFHWYFTEDVFE
jgi:hypothetical protein